MTIRPSTRWRGSTVHNILTADHYPGVTTVQVTTNFHSTPGIVEVGGASLNSTMNA